MFFCSAGWKGIVMTERGETPEQIIRKLADGHELMSGGMELVDVCRQLEIPESTWHRWLGEYGGANAENAKRLKQLEAENEQLKKLLAEVESGSAMMLKQQAPKR